MLYCRHNSFLSINQYENIHNAELENNLSTSSYIKRLITQQDEKDEKDEKYNITFLIKQSKASLWLERWFWSSNAKDIGTTYLIYAFLSGLVGTAFSVLIRLELSRPGVQFIDDNQ